MCVSQAASLTDFISVHYNIVSQHASSSVKDWKLFLCLERHGDLEMQKVNSLFVCQFATSDSFLLLEGQEAGKPISDLTLLRKFGISETRIPLHNVRGWDTVDDFKTPLYAASYTYLQNISTHLLESIASIDFQKDLPKLYQYSNPRTTKDYQKLTAKLGAELNEFVKEKVVKQTRPWQKQKMLLDKALELQQRMFTAINKEWSKRINTMRDTLEKTGVLIEKTHGKIFLFAGEDHLKESSNPDTRTSRSLKPFYDFLKGRRDIVILEPKKRLPSKELLSHLHP